MKGRSILWLSILLPLQSMGQTEVGATPADIPDLPSAKAATNFPEAEGASPAPDLSGAMEGSTTSIPQPRPPAADPAKSGSKDWAAEAMMEKQAATKKKQAEDMVLDEQKAKEAEVTKAKEAKEAKEKSKSDDGDLSQAAVAKGAVEGFKPMDENKLPSVTGADGVKPRAMGSGDGRVQPGFESFTGPSSTGPLGKDYQSGAKPIMPPGGGSDTRLRRPRRCPRRHRVGTRGFRRIRTRCLRGVRIRRKLRRSPSRICRERILLREIL